jgi:hypothetical protein
LNWRLSSPPPDFCLINKRISIQTIMENIQTAAIPDNPTATYHFVTTWNLQATCEEVYRILEDIDALAKWWPAVYLDVNVRAKGQPGGVGKIVELFTKGWLPYTLRWTFQVTAAKFPEGFSLRATGDFAGEGIWAFRQDGDACIATYDWTIAAEKPFLKYFTWLMRPIFSANHEWAMRKGLESIQLELERRRGVPDVPPPPGPTFPHNITDNKVL